MYHKYFKRAIDIICALLALVVFCWLYAIIAILVRIKLGSPVIFKQERPGKDEKIFTLYKFRTMTDERDEEGNLLPDELRLTAFGKWLRSTSLDEIPEAINILKGDMSVVGPRPLAVQYLPHYSDYEKIRHSVCPGLTGPAQIYGRNSINWDQKFLFDVDYARKVTFINDLKIVCKTIIKAINRENVSERGASEEINFDDYRRQQNLK